MTALFMKTVNDRPVNSRPDPHFHFLERVKESHNKVFGFSVRPVKDDNTP